MNRQATLLVINKVKNQLIGRDYEHENNDANAKLLYVSCTRALHELTIVTDGILSTLIE